MSAHRGVSCDKCGKSGFSGKRYKCLLCFDFDLCEECYATLGDETLNNGRHTSAHPVQCILTRADMVLYYGGENSADFAHSYTCPYCAKAGFSEQALQEHVNSQHADQHTEVVCPICASLPDGDANFVSDDFPEHLAIEHQAVRELDDSSQRLIRRIHHQRGGRMKGYHRLYASNPYQSTPPAAAATGALFPGGYAPRKERVQISSNPHAGGPSDADPLAELLTQLTSHGENVHVGAAGNIPNFDSVNEDRFERLAKQYTEYSSKYAFNQFAERPSSHETKSSFLYRSLGGDRSGGKEEAKKTKATEEKVKKPVSQPTELMKEIASLPEDKKEEFDFVQCERSLYLQEIMISSLTQEWQKSSSSDDEFDLT